jgi:hypothetical protein
MNLRKPRCALGDIHGTHSLEATEMASPARYSTLEQRYREIAWRRPMHVSHFVPRPDT